MKKIFFISCVFLFILMVKPVLAQKYQLVKNTSASGLSSGVVITGVTAGDFNVNKLKEWHYDYNNPQLTALPGGNANIYAPNLIKNGGAWNLFYGGWDGTSDLNDRLSIAVSSNGLETNQWNGRTVIIDHGDYEHVNDPSVVKVSDNQWYMAYTSAKCVNITDHSKSCSSNACNDSRDPNYSSCCYRDWISIAQSTDGYHWTPYNPTAAGEITVDGSDSLDINTSYGPEKIQSIARPSLILDNGVWRLYFDDGGQNNRCGDAANPHFPGPNVEVTTSTDLKNFTNPGIAIGVIQGQRFSLEPDVQKFGNTYFMAKGWFSNGIYGAVSNNGVNFTDIGDNNLFGPSSKPYDFYGTTNPGIVRDENRLLGIWYGSMDGPSNACSISAAYLQKKVVISNSQNTLQSEEALGPDKLVVYFPAGINQITASVNIYDTDGQTLLLQSSSMQFNRGDVFNLISAPASTPTNNPISPRPTATKIPHSPTPTPIPGDLNHDGIVNIQDYNQLVSDFGKTGSPGWIPSDINSDGKVDIYDYNILVGNWGKTQ